MTMTTFLLNSLGHDRPRSDPLFIKPSRRAVSGRVDSVPSVLQDASLFSLALFLTASHPSCVIQR